MTTNTDPGNLFPIHPDKGHDEDSSDSDLMDLIPTLRVVANRDGNHRSRESTRARPKVVIVTSDPSRYKSQEFERLGLDLLVVAVVLEAVDHLMHDKPVALLTEIELKGKDNGYRMVQAAIAMGFAGPILLVMMREPLAQDREVAKRSGASGIVLFRSVRMLQVLDEIAAAHASARPVAIGNDRGDDRGRERVSGVPSLPTWLPVVIKHLARYVGPSAGDHVRSRYAEMQARYRIPPTLMDLAEEVSEILNEWPGDKVRFMSACLELNNEGGA